MDRPTTNPAERLEQFRSYLHLLARLQMGPRGQRARMPRTWSNKPCSWPCGSCPIFTDIPTRKWLPGCGRSWPGNGPISSGTRGGRNATSRGSVPWKPPWRNRRRGWRSFWLPRVPRPAKRLCGTRKPCAWPRPWPPCPRLERGRRPAPSTTPFARCRGSAPGSYSGGRGRPDQARPPRIAPAFH